MYEFWQRDVAVQRLYIGFEITQNHFRALNSATPKTFIKNAAAKDVSCWNHKLFFKCG